MEWGNARRPGNVTKNGVATSGDVIRDWTKTSLVCNVDIMEVILPSDTEHLVTYQSSTLLIYLKKLVLP